MGAPKSWWIGSVFDLLLLPPALYMAAAAIEIARGNSGSAFAVAIAVLFSALPIFCIALPLAARRAFKRGRPAVHVASLLAAPWIYAVFLLMFVFNG